MSRRPLLRRMTAHGALLVAIATLALLVAAVLAYAYYTANGTATASAHVGTLGAPSITAATPGAQTVALSWTTVTAPGSGAVTYYVKRDGSNASAACPSAAAPTAVTSCTDTGVSIASHSYTVTAVWRSWTGVSTSQNVTVAYGPVTQLVYATQPAGATGGTAFTTQPVVTAKDAGGNTVANYAGTVGLSIKSGTGAAGAALSGCSGALSGGVTTFSGCKIDKSSGTSYKLTASDGTRTVDSGNFTVSTGAVAQLAFTQQPAGATGGTAFTTQPKVTAQDAGGNTVTTYNGTIALSLTSGTGTSGAALTNCSRNTNSGVATFSNCEIDKAGTAYQLHASDGTRTADSNAFNVTVGSFAQLAFTTQPVGGTGGLALTTQPVVTAQDAGGNTVTTYNGTPTITLRNGGTATLSGCSGTRVSGVVTYSGCTVDKAGSGYQLRAKDGTPQVDSSTFSISAGPAVKISVTTDPAGATAGSAFTTQPVVTAQDAGGNTATSYTGTVSLSIKTNPGGGTLTGCSGNRSNGVTTFSGCKLNKSGTGYVLTASDGTFTDDTAAFNVVAGAVSTLSFTTQPSGGTGGVAFATQPVVTAFDANGNVATSYASTVTLSLTSGNGATLAAGCTGNRVNGVVTFSGCKVSKAGTGYTLHATDGTRTADSSSFDVTVGPAASFVVTAADTTPTAAVGTALTIKANDAGGNLVTTYTGAHSLTFGGASTSAAGNAPTVTNSSGTAIAFGTPTSISFTAGQATTSGASNGTMTLRKAETTTITVTDGTAVDDGTLSVTVSVGAASKLAWTGVIVSNGTLSVPCLFACTDTGIGNNGTFKANVSVTDADGNVVSNIGSGHNVSLQATSGSGSFTSPSSGSTISTSLPSLGTASTAQFTFRAQSGSWTSNSFKASSSGFSDATATVTR